MLFRIWKNFVGVLQWRHRKARTAVTSCVHSDISAVQTRLRSCGSVRLQWRHYRALDDITDTVEFMAFRPWKGEFDIQGGTNGRKASFCHLTLKVENKKKPTQYLWNWIHGLRKLIRESPATLAPVALVRAYKFYPPFLSDRSSRNLRKW